MVIWNVLDESSSAAQPLEKFVAQCVGIKVVNLGCTSLGLGLHVAGARRRAHKINDVLTKLGHPCAHDSVLCSEVAGCKGFRSFLLDFRHFVQEDLPETSYFTDGAYLNLSYVPIQIAAEVQAGTWTASTGQPSYMHWQAFDLTFRDAPQLADRAAPQLAAPKVGLLVGNMHITAGKHKASIPAKRKILQQALQHLTSLEVDAWRFRKDFHIMRLLVGDCNLTKEDAEAATQNVHLPPFALTSLQRNLRVCQWEVCDDDFPGQVLETARKH